MEEAQIMKRVVYIDVPDLYPYNWDLSPHADVSLGKEIGYRTIFVRNGGASMHTRDIYAILLKNEKEEIMFRLKNKFDCVSADFVESWIFNNTSYRAYFKHTNDFVKYLETKEQEWQQLQA
jgi:hypothetical protein